eukprot:1196225-Prorocentrum_minimum.AAC.1
MTNAPNRYEKFVLPEGTKKIQYVKDTKVPNAARFIIEREDHTAGNLLRIVSSACSQNTRVSSSATMCCLEKGILVHRHEKRLPGAPGCVLSAAVQPDQAKRMSQLPDERSAPSSGTREGVKIRTTRSLDRYYFLGSFLGRGYPYAPM